MYLQYILIRFTPSIILLCPPSPRAISTDIFILFSYINIKFIYLICPSSPFPYALPDPTGTHPWKGAILLSFPSFSKIDIDSSKGFYLDISDILCFNKIYLLLLYLPEASFDQISCPKQTNLTKK
jgi:hypothetical protein